MFSKLTTKIALRRAGIPSNTFTIPEYNTKSASADPNSKQEDSELLPFKNPFTNLTVPKSWHSWSTPVPPPIDVATAPVIKTRAPSAGGKLSFGDDGRPTLIVFLRFCGCPYAEKTFLNLRKLGNRYQNLRCVAVSHCSKVSTDKWVSSMGGAWAVEIMIDEDRQAYASWGLGVSNTYYLLNPWTQLAARKLGNEEGIWARDVGDGGNRWQTGGAWAVDERGVLRWGRATLTADEQLDLEEGVASLSVR